MKRGFSLVELSIVLIILGLLTGGILAGQSLIRAAELRGVTAQMDRYRASTYTFRDKYFALPGDMSNATKFWTAADSADGAGADCFTADRTALADQRATCNGSGDGFVGQPTGGASQWLFGERYTYWQHLANAGLVEGSFTGQSDSVTLDWANTIGKNVPGGKISSTYFMALTFSAAEPACCYGRVASGRTMAWFIGLGGMPLLPVEAWNVDVKLDDGKPGQGKVGTSRVSSGSTCASSNDPLVAEYDLDGTAKVCDIYAVLF